MSIPKLEPKGLGVVLNEGELRDLVSVYRALKDYMEEGSRDSEMLRQIFDYYLFVLATILKRAGYVDSVEIPGQTDPKTQRYLM